MSMYNFHVYDRDIFTTLEIMPWKILGRLAFSMYVVIETFSQVQDNSKIYAGSTFQYV